jgi:hypothetical protein
VAAVFVVVWVGVSEDVIVLSSSSVAVRAPPIWPRRAVALEVPVIIINSLIYYVIYIYICILFI